MYFIARSSAAVYESSCSYALWRLVLAYVKTGPHGTAAVSLLAS